MMSNDRKLFFSEDKIRELADALLQHANAHDRAFLACDGIDQKMADFERGYASGMKAAANFLITFAARGDVFEEIESRSESVKNSVEFVKRTVGY